MRLPRLRLMHVPALLALALAAAGCATPPPASDKAALADFKQTNDPLEPTNRVLYAINDALDGVILHPLAVGYINAVPSPVRRSVHNALSNLDTPVLLANDMMEGKPRRAGDTFMRFVINTTVGVGGFFDPATSFGYPAHDADFGITMALWGVPEGPFLYLPVLGPSDPRDAAGYGVDVGLDPFTWVGNGFLVSDLYIVRYGLTAVDVRSSLIPDLDKVKEQALDPYATFRSLYRQHRKAQIDAARNDNRETTPDWYPSPPAAPAAH